MNDALSDATQTKLEDDLRPMLTPEFLATLGLALRTCGWQVDMIESSAFVAWCHELAGAPWAPHPEALIDEVKREWIGKSASTRAGDADMG